MYYYYVLLLCTITMYYFSCIFPGNSPEIPRERIGPFDLGRNVFPKVLPRFKYSLGEHSSPRQYFIFLRIFFTRRVSKLVVRTVLLSEFFLNVDTHKNTPGHS